MSVYSGDFLGFQLGNVHSSQLNITRVSNGDRYTEELTPKITDRKAEVPGGDGTYYWNTSYTSKSFVIDFAYDDLRDEDIRQLRQVFGYKGTKKLIFDETPYKYYMVKCETQPSLKYIAFDAGPVKVYKGEGSVTLVAYYPYGIATKVVIIKNSSNHRVLNPGDLPTNFKVYYDMSTAAGLSELKLVNDDNEELGKLQFSGITAQGTNDAYICIDMKTHLIEGLDENFQKTGKLYNKFSTAGHFFELPVGAYNVVSNVPFNKLEFQALYY